MLKVGKSDMSYYKTHLQYYFGLYLVAEKRVIDACISSKARPLVSGTNVAMNRVVKQEMHEYMKNVPDEAWPKYSCKSDSKKKKNRSRM